MDELSVQETRCSCHVETCGHWPYSLMLGSECITTGNKADCERMLALLIVRNTRAARGRDQEIAGADAMNQGQVRGAIRLLDNVELRQLIRRLDRSTRIEQAALHFARGEQRRRRRRAKKAAKAAP